MAHSIGKTIATLRKEKGWTQVELAEKLQVSDTLYKITVFKNYFPLYNPDNFGCHYCDEYNGYVPKI